MYLLSNLERLKGDIALVPPSDKSGEKELRMTLSWRALENPPRRYASVEDLAKETINQLGKAKQIGSYQIISNKAVVVNGHQTSFYNLMVKYQKRSTFLRSVPSDWVIRFFLLNCVESGRCMILYEESDYPIEKEDLFFEMVEPFSCH